MGAAPRPRPDRLAEKLAQVRAKLEMTQPELAEALSDKRWKIVRADISNFERGAREPASVFLLRYARLARVSVESLIDDELDLE